MGLCSMSAPIIERLVRVAEQALHAPNGEKQRIYAAACADLGISLATLHRKLKALTVRPTRKRRSDHGNAALSYAEASMLSAYVMEHFRKNNKRIKPWDQAVDELRANGEILAGRVDEATGEFRPLSVSAIVRAVRGYGLHPEQLLAPAPVIPLASKHPNDVWQIDPSLCVLFKLPRDNGERLEEIRSDEVYKNKLHNLARIEHMLVQRYVVTDHASGVLFLWFGLGGESTDNLVSALIAAILERPGYPFHGVPNLLMVDQASANKSAMFRNLCKALGIRIHYTKPGNPRSKGAVEKGNDITECRFESGLKCSQPITTCDQLNALALEWMHWFNGTRRHTRHKMTRYEAWQLITAEQLRRVSATADELRMLATEQPAEKPVTPYLTVNHKGAEYDVSTVPGVMVGQTLMVCRSAFAADCAMVVLHDEQGRERFHPVEIKRREGAFQFYADSAYIGEEYKSFEETPAQRAKKRLDMQAMGAQTQDEAEAARKAKATPFGGRIDPYKEAREYQPPAWLPKRGTEHELRIPRFEQQHLNAIQAARYVKGRLGDAWKPEFAGWLQERFGESGATESQLDNLIRQWVGSDNARAAGI
jgi:transposase InsO family protein